MTQKEFQKSLAESSPPEGVHRLLRALWYDARGDWEEAHRIAQSVEGRNGAWVHGYLHRKEGDLSNAEYWYSRAGRRNPGTSLEWEWEQLVKAFL